ncbi:hypothetical protein [Thermaerobacillus caldiproteolyticus]|uniref:Flagellar biosynthesis chaperone FliJ n=1 Tax=Thermaerobacillus caldiproteolyticus TaxID=247480 RepID=A0A7W0BYG8_9BACL|nr:hypothetical protein [Anoxybacillus caldiproteolyticus]MBA2874958.1 flagellar biosynthesis chaperone FliJ [Anoxybacillus caldiproteolyticus]QPA31757.1 hypothetical protein ISX45_01715 [Anoxybacillus caldiproteolyticus]
MKQHPTTANIDQQIQLQQKIIHYRSEISSYENKLKSLETKLQKEKLRNKYLQEKLHLAESINIEQYEKKIAQLENQLLSYEVALEEANNQINNLKKILYSNKQEEKKSVPSIVKMQAIFNYSLILPQANDAEDIVIIGDFIISNLGTEPLQNIITCIRITPKKAGELSGKITIKPLKSKENDFVSNQTSPEWTFAYENWRDKIRNEGEYWIKPTHPEKLMPNEELRFSNFDIRVKKIKGAHSVVIDGFVYCQEIPNGVPSSNSITIN